MTDQTCIVSANPHRLSDLIESGRLTHPRARRRAEDLLDLIKDICTGSRRSSASAGPAERGGNHCHGRAGGIFRRNRRIVGKALESHREVFVSHIETHNCPTGDCEILTPAPCQMACPAGIDVASYVGAHRPGPLCRGRGTDPQGQSLSPGSAAWCAPTLRIRLRSGARSTIPLPLRT